MGMSEYVEAQSKVIQSMGKEIEMLKLQVKFHKQIRNWIIIFVVIGISLYFVL